MDEEIEALEHRKTWTIFDLLKDRKVFRCRRAYVIKYKDNGDVDWYKARLVAKDYTQNYGVDYFGIFTLISKMSTCEIIIVLEAHKGWNLDQFDVNSEFYMEIWMSIF